ncbi:MAG: TolC family protein [candidate division KSB1 bacterium]|nr:TolC family protein [candidate division KSB1 bacterium]MDZ7335177.1 TolC family protein [candidate division KSB1 bacterium]MDZ7356860.1 TolC family protein [candidate division KSB1 bacterium]MDZ7375404.1 TolC family protein [candidate division KSB1 bacterium]MDZ7401301.1 TolC family protein [candidate division KSB1 bacterium]
MKKRALNTIMLIMFSASLIFELALADDSGDQNPFQQLKSADTLKIDLREAILTALEHNPSLSIQRLTPKISQTVVKEQGAIYDPTISASINKTKTKQQRFLGSRPEPFELVTDRSQYDAGLSQNLPFGTSVSANASMSTSLSNIYTDQYSGNVGITITQSLLQGFGLGANLASLRRARLDYEISRAELRRVAEEVIASVEKAYWDLYLTREEINIQQRSLELANKQLKESQERVAVGKLPELELAAVHAEVATRKEALIDAQSRYEQARLRLLYLLNPSQTPSWNTVPWPLDRPFVPTDTLDALEIHEQLAMKYRPDLKQARLSLKKGDVEIARTRNGLLPRLDFFITLGRTTYSKTFREAIPDVQSPFYEINGGLSFSFPLTDRKAIAQYARAKYSQEQQELALHNMEQLVQWDVRSAYIEVLRSREQISATRVARELQTKKLDAELEKFRVGKSTNFLVLQAQRDLIASQLNEARAMVAYLNALVNLYLMEGTLLERRGIDDPSKYE